MREGSFAWTKWLGHASLLDKGANALTRMHDGLCINAR